MHGANHLKILRIKLFVYLTGGTKDNKFVPHTHVRPQYCANPRLHKSKDCRSSSRPSGLPEDKL